MTLTVVGGYVSSGSSGKRIGPIGRAAYKTYGVSPGLLKRYRSMLCALEVVR